MTDIGQAVETHVQVVNPETFKAQMTNAALQADSDEIVLPRTGVADYEHTEPTPRRITHVRRRLTSIRQQVDDLYLETGQLLREAHQNRYFIGWGFDSFEQYAESELRMRRRKAFYLISVADAFHRLAIQPAEREGISLSNAVELAAATREHGQPLEITPERREELLQAARTQTTRELRQTLRDERGLPPVEFSACNFAVTTDQKLIIDQALEACRRQAGATEDEISRGRLLELVCAEFLAGTAGLTVQRTEPTGAMTVETAQARAREALHDLSALDPDGYVVEAVVKDVVGMDTLCPNCGVPMGVLNLDIDEEEEHAPLKTEIQVSDLFVRSAA
jgi:hypothetical protein